MTARQWRDKDGRTRWLDGAGRVTIRFPTNGTLRQQFVMGQDRQPLGIVRRDGWLQIYGPATVQIGNDAAEMARVYASEQARIRERARYHWQQRHGPKSARSRGYGPPVEDEADCPVVDEDMD